MIDAVQGGRWDNRFYSDRPSQPDRCRAGYVEFAVEEQDRETAGKSGGVDVHELYRRQAGNKDIPKTEEEETESEEQESKTDSEIIVRPDGTRILVTTLTVGGTEATMSVELSGPTDMPNQAGNPEDGAEEGTDMAMSVRNLTDIGIE